MANKWGNNGNSERLYFGGLPKSLQMVTAVMKSKDTCSLEEKLLQARSHIKKQRHYFANKGPSSQSYGFSSSHVRMWELDYKESWAAKNWCFELWCWRRLLRVPWMARRSNQLILKEINLEYSLEELMLKLKSSTLATWCEELTHLQRFWCWEKLKSGEGNNREWNGWMATPTRWTWVWACSRSWRWIGKPGVLQFMGSQSLTRLSNWTELNWAPLLCCYLSTEGKYFPV